MLTCTKIVHSCCLLRLYFSKYKITNASKVAEVYPLTLFGSQMIVTIFLWELVMILCMQVVKRKTLQLIEKLCCFFILQEKCKQILWCLPNILRNCIYIFKPEVSTSWDSRVFWKISWCFVWIWQEATVW